MNKGISFSTNRASRFAILMILTSLAIVGCGKKNESVPSSATVTPQPAIAPAPTLADLKSADGQTAHVMDRQDLNNLLVQGKDFNNVGGGDFVVSGYRKFDGWFIKADRIIFESGATLTFSKTALSNRRQFWVVTKELIVKDPNSPGTITWEKSAAAPAPASPGEAPGGPSATEDNAAGGGGQPGGKGIAGNSGENAPQVTLVVMKVPNSGVLIDLTGGDGGPGGQGQKGGRGGNGAKGNPASQSLVDCKRGGGNGGSGGNGGQGGPGGDGGTGGVGGTFLIVSSAELLPSLTQKFVIKRAGGNAGGAGQGGVGGDFGLGGPGGQDAQPHCGGGNGGPNGAQGNPGGIGVAGHSGQEGDFTVGSATDAQFATYIWGSGK